MVQPNPIAPGDILYSQLIQNLAYGLVLRFENKKGVSLQIPKKHISNERIII